MNSTRALLEIKPEMLDAFRNAGQEPEYDEAGIIGRGLYFARTL